MATRVASIYAEVGMDNSKFNSGSKQVLSGLDDITGAFGVSALKAATLAGAATIVVDQLSKAHAAATEAAIAQANLAASLKSTGNAAGLTADELNKTSESLAYMTGVDDELITSAQAMLLTFKDVKGEVFNEATLAAIDMQAKGYGNLEGNIVQVGKALSSFSGYTALQRAGVNFNEVQLAQIKAFKETNNLAGYQALVLKELQSQVGGTAAAINAAGDGSANLNIELGNLYENIGNLMPGVNGLIRGFTDLLRVLNQNFAYIAAVYNGLQRIRVAVQTLGFSELYRAITGAYDVIQGFFSGGSAPAASNSAPGFVPTTGLPGGANGGSFIVPQGYGYEGFRMGNSARASGGERITITPASQSAGDASLVMYGDIIIGDTSNLSREDITNMIGEAFTNALGLRA